MASFQFTEVDNEQESTIIRTKLSKIIFFPLKERTFINEEKDYKDRRVSLGCLRITTILLALGRSEILDFFLV